MKNAFLRGWICVFAKKIVPLQSLALKLARLATTSLNETPFGATLCLRWFGGKAAGLRLLELRSV